MKGIGAYLLGGFFGIAALGCLDMSMSDPKPPSSGDSCPEGYLKLSYSTCPSGQTCKTLPDGTLCVARLNVDSSGGDGPNCRAGYVTVSASEAQNCWFPEDPDGEELSEERFVCREGNFAGRYCRRVPPERDDSLISVLAGQRCTEAQRNPDRDTLRVHVIDVGQGDAIWIQTPTGQNVLIDGGDGGFFGRTSAGPIISDYLEFNGFPRGSQFDAVFLSHPHSDHFGGFSWIFSENSGGYRLLNYIDPMEPNTTQDVSASYKSWLSAVKSKVSADRLYMPAEEKFSVSSVMPADFFGPNVTAEYVVSNKSPGSNPNSASMIFRISYAGRAFLFTGDAEARQEMEAIEKAPEMIVTNFLKVCHHGSETSSSTGFLDAIWQGIAFADRGALISSGRMAYSGTYLPSGNIVGRLRTMVPEKQLLSTSAGDDGKSQGDEYRDDNILVVVKPNGDFYACYSGTN
ncbi:MAG: MBL fold metallo-hydrolase [Proteobacteria bacterium]|nr:MBL fold metallo-hydrolase [Pseudomonadota bacterium]